MVRHWRWLRVLCALFIIQPASAADIDPFIVLSISDEPVYLGDSVIIELESAGVEDPLDISPLLEGADLLRETVGSLISVLNDQVVETKSRRMELLPHREGRVVFGPLTGSTPNGPVTSNSVVIDVQPATRTQWQPTDDELQISVSLTMGDGTSSVDLLNAQNASGPAAQPFIGQHIIADIALRHQHPIADEQVVLPDFDGFDVLEQFVERRTLENRDNEAASRVTAWRYHLFAQRSGSLRLGPVSWKGTMIRSRTQRAVFAKQSSAVMLNVQPAIDSTLWWLPASDISLDDSWSKDPRELSAGDEILRTITLTARDVLANHLPDVVPPESRALTTTPIRQSRSQSLNGNHVLATAVFEFRMIAQSPIPVFLDTVRVPWYNTVSSEERQAIIPARRINVGLPDRADLLASLALDGSWTDKLLLQLEGSSIARSLPWSTLLALSCLAAAGLWLQELRHCLEERRRRKQGLKSTVLPEL